MNRYSIEQRVFIVKNYFKHGESYAEVGRKFRSVYGRKCCPSHVTIQKIIKQFIESGSLRDERRQEYHRSGRSEKNIAAVSCSVKEKPKTSIRRRSQQLTIPRTTLFRILHEDIHLKAYKIQITQQIKPADFELRRKFCKWAIEIMHENETFFQKVIFSDEAYFELGGFVNTQNCRIWANENPREILPKQFHPPKVNVWCGFWAGGVIGPYFFQNEAGNSVTVNGARYRDMIRNFLFHKLEGMDTQNMWFQQDGATSHTTKETIALLRERFGDRLISRNANITWPSRSCDLTPLDFFFWAYLKEKVYINDPQTITDLKDNIIHEIGEIKSQLCQKVIENFCKRMYACRVAAGGHLQDIIFHY